MTTQTIDLGKVRIKSRLTVKNLRRLKEEGGIDFAGQDTAPMLDFAVDPINVVMVCYYLYQDQFEQAGIDENELADLCGPEQIDAIRTEVTDQMKSFSRFWKIVSTEMEGLQSGSISPLLAQAVQKAKEVSGPSS